MAIIDDGLLRRLRQVPEDELVAELRRLHARGGGRRRPAPRRGRAADADAGAPDRYEEARRVFADEEARLRRQASVVERIIDRLRTRDGSSAASSGGGGAAAAPAPRAARPHGTQELLVLRAASGRAAGGRFRLANHYARTLDVALDAAPLRRRDGSGTVACPIAVVPSRVRLEPGATEEIRVVVDLGAAAPLAAGTVLDGEVVARAEATCLHRLWIEIGIYAAPEEDAP